MSLKKLKILIVDDEEAARKFIISSLDWQRMNMEIMGEAVSGLEALAMMEEQVPDILFTDIKMPYMDGLELSQLVASRYPHVKIIILTAFKDFDYAKKSIAIGVSHFLLKPINRVELHATICKLQEQIDKEKQQWFEYGHLKEILIKNRDILRERFLLEFLEKSQQTPAVEKQISYYFPQRVIDYVQVTLLELQEHSRDEMAEEEKILRGMKILEFVRNYIKSDERIELLLDKEHRLILISFSAEIQMSALCEQIQQGIHQTSGIDIAFGIGGAYEEIYEMSRSFQEAGEALKYSRYTSNQPIVVYQNDLHLQNTGWHLSQGQIEDIKFYIKAGLQEQLKEELPKLYQDGEGKLLMPDYARILSMNLLSAGANAANEIGMPTAEILGKDTNQFLQILLEPSSQRLEKRTISCLCSLAESVAAFRSNKSKSVLWEILQYIQKESSNPELTLTAVAEVFHMNDSYLSRSFKKELGFSFSKYLNRLRMEKAILLIDTTDLKAYQIGEAVGIPDAYYFSNCFKKYTGKSIREYRGGSGRNKETKEQTENKS